MDGRHPVAGDRDRAQNPAYRLTHPQHRRSAHAAARWTLSFAGHSAREDVRVHELAGCRVATPSGDVGGYVTEYADGVLRMRADAALPGLQPGESIGVTVLDPVRGVCSYAGLVAAVEARDDGAAVDVVVVEDLARHQRRAAARAAYRCSCVATLEGGASPASLRVTVLDVSATGARFMAPEELHEGATLRLGLPVGEELVDLRLRVVRHEVSSTGTRYGATLVDPSERTRDALYRLVLRLQREQARHAAEHW
ncbi:hypothetical protein CELD12_14030 [Cellulomonas sp. NTE-D12]|nr:hypothetical protein CELD12_14030 [Cellulomonas sp. NTE-D12]